MMSISTSLRLGALTQKLLLLSVTQKSVCQLGVTASTRQVHCLTRSPSASGVLSQSRSLGLEAVTGRMLLIPTAEYSTSFFVKHTAEQIWKGVTSVSNAGRKRGRGKGNRKKTPKDLNRGQVIGVGKANIVWPGLNAPILQGKELVERRQLPPDKEREAKLIKLRDAMGQFKPLLLSPLERGWSGTKMHGRSIGAPDPIGEDTFDGFDTKVLEMKTVTNMDGVHGRVRRFSVLVFTGNKDGLAGFALAKSPDGRGALKRAKNRAGQKLLFIQRYNDHTVLHDFYTQFGKTRILVYKKPEGFGLVCHRAIREMCILVGIKDIYAKVMGPSNIQNLVKAFVLGLIRQKSHDQIAEEKGLYLVEQRHDQAYFPTVLAEPSQCREAKDIGMGETLNFSHHCLDDRIPIRKKPFEPFYKVLPSWENHLLKTEWRRNHPEVKRYLTLEYGRSGWNGTKSHLTSKYPEADSDYGYRLRDKRRALEAAQEEE